LSDWVGHGRWRGILRRGERRATLAAERIAGLGDAATAMAGARGGGRGGDNGMVRLVRDE
jgi:hypothetical protein